MPLFIVEGLDRTGKTSLCESQPVTTRSRYYHFSAPKKHPLEEYILPFMDYLPGAGETIWVDRHYLGELVWPHIFGRASKLDAPMARYIEMFLQSRGAVGIYAQRDSNELVEACRNEPVAGQIEYALDLFAQARWQSLIWWRPYQLGDQVSYFVCVGKKREYDVARIHKITEEWVGWHRPDVLLVGEQVNNPTGHHWSLPFVPFRNTSGHFLMAGLAELPNIGFAICNAVKRNGRHERLRDVWEAMERPQVVALGKTACRSLATQDVPHADIPHPQYVRRFKRSEEPGYYAKLIEESLA